MDIEKINDDQIKFILTKADLEERDLALSDLSYGSEKTQELFREIMREALMQCDFHSNGQTPLVVEAIPLSGDSIMIIVSKASGHETLARHFNLQQPGKEQSVPKPTELCMPEAAAQAAAKPNASGMVICVFHSLDDAAAGAARVCHVFSGESKLIKHFGQYYLVLHGHPGSVEGVMYILSEYGKKHSDSALSLTYLLEHGEMLVAQNAVEAMAAI